MKFLKGPLLIALSFALGVGVSHFLTKKEDTPRPTSTEEHHEEQRDLELTKNSQELIDLKTQEAKLARFTKKISVVGQIAQDPASSIYVSAPVSGVIAECKARTGTVVKKDETICIVKSGDSLIEVKSPVPGMVISDLFKPGDKIDTVSSMHTIADLSKLWATFDVYEKDIANVKLGQKVIARSIAYPEETFTGEITFVSPKVDETTRTIKIRALIENTDYSLRLGMFVSGEIIVETEEEYLILPASAVQIIDAKKAVFVRIEDERFQMKEVKIKLETKDEAVIIEGLKEGDSVVVDGAFLLKSDLLKSQLEEE